MKSADGRFIYQDKDGDALPEGSNLADVGRFSFECRSQQGNRCSINVRNAGYEIPQHNWALTGTVDEPTISPSINCENCWHGYIEAGKFCNTAQAGGSTVMDSCDAARKLEAFLFRGNRSPSTESNDWVTIGRITIDPETETETFVRAPTPPARPVFFGGRKVDRRQ